MRATLFLSVLLVLAGAALPTAALARADALWARNADAFPLVLDGVLNEFAWTKAESLNVVYGRDTGIPGSGWKLEGGLATPNDSLKATLKFLVKGDYLYLGAKVKDRFIGGSSDWQRFDGFLMSLKDHLSPNAPKPPNEYFYSWWYPGTGDPQPVGAMPVFKGRWGNDDPYAPRLPEQIANWDAVTVVSGTTNSDTVFDTGYTVEMRFKLSVMGYDAVRTPGDIIEWNISIYDCDGYWPLNGAYFCTNRTWVQSPWGWEGWYGELRLWTRPEVTVLTVSLPTIGPEVHIMNGSAFATPNIDGQLNEAIWGPAGAPPFDIRYGDDALRVNYPYVGRYRAGQYQPTVNGGLDAILDPADATVRMFFKGTKLYLGFDVRDQVVQYHTNFDRWDGFIVTLNDRVLRNPDHALQGRRLAFQIGPTGQAMASDYLLTMVQAGTASIATTLKPGTVVDTLGNVPDAGYYGEMSIDLTALGYPADLGDHVVFIGVNLLDGDTIESSGDAYGSRTWWFRQYEGECCPAWAFLDVNLTNSVEFGSGPGDEPVLLRNYPNPGARTTIRYSLAQGGPVQLEVYDVQGRMVERRPLGARPAGDGQVEFDGAGRPAGLYLYQLLQTEPRSGADRLIGHGRMVIVD